MAFPLERIWRETYKACINNLLSDREKSILEKGEIVHNKRFFFFRQCFRDYNTCPFILA